jgi:hypothetical protein
MPYSVTPKTKRPMATGTVVAEVRRVKAELLKRCNYDLAAMARDARERQSRSGHEVVNRSAGA